MTTTILRTTARTVMPLVIVLAVALFLQGHNRPGGGFIAGVLTVAGVALVYIAYDAATVEALFDRSGSDRPAGVGDGVVLLYDRLLVGGLVLAAVAGAVPMLAGDPFLSQYYTYVHAPLVGEVEIASAIAFDLGIYGLVVGALLTALSVVGAE